MPTKIKVTTDILKTICTDLERISNEGVFEVTNISDYTLNNIIVSRINVLKQRLLQFFTLMKVKKVAFYELKFTETDCELICLYCPNFSDLFFRGVSDEFRRKVTEIYLLQPKSN